MVKKKKKSLFSADECFSMAEEYNNLSAQIKVLEARKNELAKNLKSSAESLGTKDDKGSFYIENDYFVVGKVAKKSFKINQELACSILEEKGLEDVIDVVTTRVVNEDKLNSAVQAGSISLNEVEDFTDCSTSYSVSVVRKDCVPEIEQSTLKSAARKK